MKKSIKLILVSFLVVSVIVTAGMILSCRGAEIITGEEESEIEVTDGTGNRVVLEKPAEKVIVLSLGALEIIEGLGAMDRVAGVDSWSVEMGEPLAEGFEGVGDVMGLNLERIAEIGPEIIITVEGGPEEDYQKAKEFGVEIYIVSANNIEDVYREIENVGKIIGLSNQAIKLQEELKMEVENIYFKIKDLDEGEKPKVFYMVWNEPLMSAGKDTFINDLIEKAGGRNIVTEDGLSGWPEYSLEKLIENNPDIIIAPLSLAPTPDIITGDGRFQSVEAVLNRRVYIVSDNPVVRPSQNIIKGLKMFSKAIHPEVFGEFELIE